MSLPQKYNLLSKHLNAIYIETGIYRGDSLQMAIDAGFDAICGIDNDPDCIEFCKRRFDLYGDNSGRINLRYADSAVYLGAFLASLNSLLPNTKITFFLDSHWQMLEGTEPGHNPFPLLQELKHIAAKRHCCGDTIIIDDMLIMQDNIVGYNEDDILKHLEIIDPNFNITRIANPVINGILIAKP